jgi:hypothetical protein
MAPSAAVKESVFTTAVRAVADSKSYRDQAALAAVKVIAARTCFPADLVMDLSEPTTKPKERTYHRTQRSTSSAASNANRQPPPGRSRFLAWDPGRSSHRGLASPCGVTSSQLTSARRYAGSWLSSAGSHPVDRGGSIRQGRAAGLVRRGVSNFSRVGEESVTLAVAKHVDPIGPGTGSFLAADHNQSIALVSLVVLHLLTVLRPTGRRSFP